MIKRDSPIDRGRKTYVPGGIEDPRIPFRVYDNRLVGGMFGRFSHVSGEVVDIGCGRKPFPWAKYLVDFNPFGTKEGFPEGVPGVVEGSKKTILGLTSYSLDDGRVIFVMDLSRDRLPFSQNGLDYIFSNQVIEHMEDPGHLLSEFNRAGRAGCIRWPAMEHELLYLPFGVGKDNEHKWMIELREGVMHFRRPDSEELGFIEWRKKSDDRESSPTHFSPEISKAYMDFIKRYSGDPTLNELFWEGSIEFDIAE